VVWGVLFLLRVAFLFILIYLLLSSKARTDLPSPAPGLAGARKPLKMWWGILARISPTKVAPARGQLERWSLVGDGMPAVVGVSGDNVLAME